MPHALHLCMLLPGMLLKWLTDTITTASSNHNECCGKAIPAYFTMQTYTRATQSCTVHIAKNHVSTHKATWHADFCLQQPLTGLCRCIRSSLLSSCDPQSTNLSGPLRCKFP
jgi:hypothetical protein